MAADRIHIAEPAPSHCSSCYQQKPRQPHVDFGASYDGPVVPALQGTIGTVGHMIDELILCEDCIRSAAELLGWEDVTAVRAELEEARQVRDMMHHKIEALQAHNERLTATVASKDQLDSVVRSNKTRDAGTAREALKQMAERSAPPKRRQSAASKAAASTEGEK